MTTQEAADRSKTMEWYSECLQLTFPPVMVKLLQALAQPEPDFSVIAELLAMDPVLAATILELVNSPYYGQRNPVSDMQRAVVVLGSREILKIALSVAYQQRVSGALHRKPTELFPDWRMALWSAIAAEKLSAQLAPGDEALAYLAALLKDLGIFIRQCTRSSDPVLARRRYLTEYSRAHATSEQVHWGKEHQELSAELFSTWNMPQRFVDAVRHHHAPTLNGLDPFTLCVALATRWAELLQTGQGDHAELIRHEMLMAGLLQLDGPGMEALRADCATRFRVLLSSLGIEDAPLSDRLYTQTLEDIQRFHFLSTELQRAASYEEAVKMTGRQLHWLWNMKKWEVALRDPSVNRYVLFRPVPEQGVQPVASSAEVDALPWSRGGVRLPLAAEGDVYGSMNVPRSKTRLQEEGSLAVYARFLSKGLEIFYTEQSGLRSKARLLDSLPNMVAQVDATGIIREANTAFLALAGQDSDPRGHALSDVLRNAYGIETESVWRQITAETQNNAANKIFTYCTTQGAARTCALLSIFRNLPEQGAFLVRIEDITQVSALEAEVLEQNDFLSSLMEAMQEVVFTVDATGRVLWTSSDMLLQAGAMLFDIAAATTPGAAWGADHLPVQRQADTAEQQTAHPQEKQTPVPVEVAIKLPDGSSALYELSVSPLKTRAETARWIIVGRDLTSIRRMEEKMRMQAVFDGLTGLFNHTHFHMLLDREIARCHRTRHPLALIFLDLDGFKAINDTQGHREGDRILRQVSNALRSCIRKGTDFACRYGGDEFTVIVTEFKEDALPAMSARILDAIESGTSGAVSASVGVALLQSQDSAESLVQRADTASYAAKKAGGRQVAQAPLHPGSA
jgi:diguanylate cyclase (GGDEF)-like protein